MQTQSGEGQQRRPLLPALPAPLIVVAAVGLIAAVLLAVVNVVYPSPQLSAPNGRMTLATFYAITNGESCSSMVARVGRQGTVLSDSDVAGTRTTMYGWDGEGSIGANAMVLCQNGLVVMKAQSGLR